MAFYSWLVEFRPPVTRASILIGLLCVGRLIGRRSLSFNWLAIAGFLVLIINPADLFALGPQLSFLAVGTIIFASDWMFWKPSEDPLDRLIANTRPPYVRWLNWMGCQTRTAFLVGGIIWMVALPLVAHEFHLVTPIALVLSPVLLIPMALALYSGLGVLLFGGWFPLAGKFCGVICGANLGFVDSLVHWAADIEGGHFWTAGPSAWAVLIFYLFVWYFAIYPKTKRSAGICFWVFIGWLCFAWFLPAKVSQLRTENRLSVTFVDVGHGTGVVLGMPTGETVLYDAGGLNSARYAAQNISGVLWDQGKTRLDAVFISHADIDHFNALSILAERFAIGKVYVSEVMATDESANVVRLFEQLKERRIAVETLSKGMRLEKFGVSMNVLHPQKLETGGNNNSNSLVLGVHFENSSLLLAGDLENEGMEALLSMKPQHFDLVMAPHHGSGRSRPLDFFEWTTPSHVVVSASAKKIDRALIEEWKDHGLHVHGTFESGAVVVELGDSVDAEGILVSDWK